MLARGDPVRRRLARAGHLHGLVHERLEATLGPVRRDLDARVLRPQPAEVVAGWDSPPAGASVTGTMTRMRGGRAGLLTGALAAIAALAAAAPAAQARDQNVTSFDGTQIVTHFFPAKGLAAGAKAPTVLVGHGWAGRGATDIDGGTGEGTQGNAAIGDLHRAGYNVLTWDARGFGGSGGQVNVDGPDFEGRDVQSLITFVANQPEARLDAAGDPRLGMAGGSYGGGIQLVTAGLDKRVDAIVPGHRLAVAGDQPVQGRQHQAGLGLAAGRGRQRHRPAGPADQLRLHPGHRHRQDRRRTSASGSPAAAPARSWWTRSASPRC